MSLIAATATATAAATFTTRSTLFLFHHVTT
jgi:hypothetical protein